ncbi:precorrin-2 C20-methyltransferase / precorrin-3B C17-methyltransferase [Actinacidiphila guanduensis]|uniref:Precorrin-2 C20-methyltransferase / precorrin-3B C17-methyltransferase n=2 Tax=Actinacidiphila guanduensis TaxID=310781 RepID=A0A1G9XZ44_9ACTN|nr:precorrin-2 C20-methyltransferase / precorrin-3B C17-methyltransferase [Actinacidiphila guanduensis]
MTGTARLYGVGLGPGDPSLMTLRAVEAIAAADVVAYHSARHGRSIARAIAARHIRADHIEEPLVYPVTTESTDHPGGYRGAMDAFYEEAAERLAAHLDAGRSVAVLAEGDPLFYGSYMHMHKRLAHRYPTEVVPGVTSMAAAAARLGTPLAEGGEVLTVLPGTLPEEELAARLAATDAAVVMKLGRTFPAVRRALERTGRLAEAHYVERATMPGERTADLSEVAADSVPYFAVAVVPGRAGRIVPQPTAGQPAHGDTEQPPAPDGEAPDAAQEAGPSGRPASAGAVAAAQAADVLSVGSAAAESAPRGQQPADGTLPAGRTAAAGRALGAEEQAPADTVPGGRAAAATLPDAGGRTAPVPAATPGPVPGERADGTPPGAGGQGTPVAPVTGGAVSGRPEAARPVASGAETPGGGAELGEVVVVGTGPAGPLWLTPESRGALAGAEDLVGYATYLDRVPVRPGQRRHRSDNRVEAERAEFALELARRGRRVAVVSGGDPGVFAMATAVLEAACEPRYADVPVRVLPGVTAANAAAARAGAPLGHDYATLSLSDRLKPWEVIAGRLRAAAAADLVLALYNPGSRSRTWQVAKARELLLEHRAPDTPVVVARDVGGPDERVRTVRLADLEPAEVDMRTLLIVGSSQTRAVLRPGGDEVVWTPRRYPEPSTPA